MLNIITPAHQAHKSFLKPSQLPGEYTAQLLPFRRFKHNNQLGPHRYPFTPGSGWREAITVKCLAQGHKRPGRGLNPHSMNETAQPSEHKSNELQPLGTWYSCMTQGHKDTRTQGHKLPTIQEVYTVQQLYNIKDICRTSLRSNINKWLKSKCCPVMENWYWPYAQNISFSTVSFINLRPKLT